MKRYSGDICPTADDLGLEGGATTVRRTATLTFGRRYAVARRIEVALARRVG